MTHLYWTACTLAFGLAVFFSPAMDRLGLVKPVAAFATASYSIYLLHQPILAYLGEWVLPHMAPFAALIYLTGVAGLLSIWAALYLDTVVARINARIG